MRVRPTPLHATLAIVGLGLLIAVTSMALHRRSTSQVERVAPTPAFVAARVAPAAPVQVVTRSHARRHATATASAAPAAPAPIVAGMRAYRDPETGLIGGMPPAGQESVVGGNSAAAPELQQIQLPDGSWMVDLQGTNEDYVIVRLDANGKPVLDCTKDAHQALQSAPAPAPAPRYEER